MLPGLSGGGWAIQRRPGTSVGVGMRTTAGDVSRGLAATTLTAGEAARKVKLGTWDEDTVVGTVLVASSSECAAVVCSATTLA